MNKQFSLLLLFLYATPNVHAAEDHRSSLLMNSDDIRRNFMIILAGTPHPTLCTPKQLRKDIFALTVLEQRSNVRLPKIENRKQYLAKILEGQGIDLAAFCYGILEEDQDEFETIWDDKGLMAQWAQEIHQLKERKKKYILSRRKMHLREKIKEEKDPIKQITLYKGLTGVVKELDRLSTVRGPHSGSESDSSFELIEKS